MKLTSAAFDDGAEMPRQYTCDGEGTPPPLSVADVPEGAASLSLTVTDPDAPHGTFLHWDKRGMEPDDASLAGGTQEPNSAGEARWYPPCPPSGVHRYVFTVTAVDEDGSVLESASLTGIYRRP